ncbi:MAG: flavodoxin family protein [Candidatus Ranarchaeia archaeon]
MVFDQKKIIIVGVVGSSDPKGGTYNAIKSILTGAKQASTPEIQVETHLINISEHKIKFCTHCEMCKDPTYKENTGNWCIHQDEMEKWYQLMLDCDAYILGTANQQNLFSPPLKVWIDRLRPVWDGVNRSPKAMALVAVNDFEDPGIESSFRSVQCMGGQAFKGSKSLYMAADLMRKKLILPIINSWDRKNKTFPEKTIQSLKKHGEFLVWDVNFIRAAFKQLKITPRPPLYASRPVYGKKTADKEINDIENIEEIKLAKKKKMEREKNNNPPI